MAIARVQIPADVVVHMLDLPEGTEIYDGNGIDKVASVLMVIGGEAVPDAGDVTLVYDKDEYGLPALVSIDPA